MSDPPPPPRRPSRSRKVLALAGGLALAFLALGSVRLVSSIDTRAGVGAARRSSLPASEASFATAFAAPAPPEAPLTLDASVPPPTSAASASSPP